MLKFSQQGRRVDTPTNPALSQPVTSITGPRGLASTGTYSAITLFYMALTRLHSTDGIDPS